MTTLQKANRISELQQGTTSYAEEREIRELFLSTQGDELVLLKNLVDSRGSHQDLEKLLFHDLDEDDMRLSILKHIWKESKNTKNYGLKFFSDIDDTIYANLKDKRFPQKTIYPGVTTFYRELNKAALPVDKYKMNHLVFITARPEDRVGAVENTTHKMLIKAGFLPSVILTGDLPHFFTAEDMFKEKMDNLRRYANIYPEYFHIFIGDSGQGDIKVAEALRKEFPQKCPIALIHQINSIPQKTIAQYAQAKIYFFQTFVGAANIAYYHKLISKTSLKTVIDQAINDFKKIKFETKADRQARAKELQKDILESPFAKLYRSFL